MIKKTILSILLIILTSLIGCNYSNVIATFEVVKIGTAHCVKIDGSKNWKEIWERENFSEPRIVKEWMPNVFAAQGVLSLKWSYDKTVDMKIATAIPEGWIIGQGKSYDPNQETGIYDPAKGWRPKKIGMPGVTDGTNVYGYIWPRYSSPTSCWDIKTGEEIWSNQQIIYGNSQYLIVDSALLFISKPSSINIIRHEPTTGGILWSMMTKNDYSGNSNVSWVKTNESLMIICNRFTTDNDKVIPKESLIYKINPKSGAFQTLKISGLNSTSVCSIGDFVWILFPDGTLIEIDSTGLKETRAYIAKQLDSIQSVGKKIIFANKAKTQYAIFDPASETITNIGDCDKAYSINSSLIIEDQTQLRGVDPDTLETLWWIDKRDLGENAHVAWLDWRGVCVISDTKIMCFGQK